jgi:hypothetical protein
MKDPTEKASIARQVAIPKMMSKALTREWHIQSRELQMPSHTLPPLEVLKTEFTKGFDVDQTVESTLVKVVSKHPIVKAFAPLIPLPQIDSRKPNKKGAQTANSFILPFILIVGIVFLIIYVANPDLITFGNVAKWILLSLLIVLIMAFAWSLKDS